MKKLLTSLLLTLSLLPFTSVMAEDNIRVYIDGTEIQFEQPPVIEDGFTLVPMRAMFEALNANVDWDGEAQTVTGSGYGVLVTITIGKDTMMRSSVDVPLDVPAKIINDYTMIPLRAVSECFGMDVQWDGENRVITLTDMHTIGRYEWNDTYYYIGELKNNTPIGYGELHNRDTDKLTDIGLFDGGKYLINGTAFYDDGDTYMGEFENGLKSGYGVYYFADGTMMGGTWANNKLNGDAKIYYADGAKYEGNCIDGFPNGEGTYIYNDGDAYHGEWKDGYYDGLGVYTMADGRYMCGWYKEGKHHGPTDYYSTNGDYLGRTVYYENKTIDECYEEELKEVDKWYDEEYAKIQDIYDEIDELNKNPLSSDIAKSIMNSSIYASGNSTSASGGSIDSFSAANAMRNQQAIKAANEQRALQAVNQRIYQLQSSIPILQQTLETGYKIKVGEAKDKWNGIEQQLIKDYPLNMITN